MIQIEGADFLLDWIKPLFLCVFLSWPRPLVAGNEVSEHPTFLELERKENDGKIKDGQGDARTLAPEQENFWRTLSAYCGRAYTGRLAEATENYRASLAGRAVVIHFYGCSDDRLHITLHLDDDRSRNLILKRINGTLRLKHDHRLADGKEDQISQYGGDAPVPGMPTRQIFWADTHTATILPERKDNFWFLDLTESKTLSYGVYWPTTGHSARFVFDLSKQVDPPPPPWGW